MDYLPQSGHWLKGNLHTHTNRSDGKKTPEECQQLYRQAGCHFLSLTDHNRFHPGGWVDDLLLISGTELHYNDWEHRKAYHIVGLGLRTPVEADLSPQESIQAVQQAGGLAVLAHPAWSLLSPADMISLQAVDAVEIWNTVSHAYSARGDSGWLIDAAAVLGLRRPLLAVDDTHFYHRDALGGWLMVNSDAWSQESILDSIRHGRCYGTQGPEIKRLFSSGGKLCVQCSPAETIVFFTDSFFSPERIQQAGSAPLEEACYTPLATDNWVRVEVIDAAGRKAWTQIIPLAGTEGSGADDRFGC